MVIRLIDVLVSDGFGHCCVEGIAGGGCPVDARRRGMDVEIAC